MTLSRQADLPATPWQIRSQRRGWWRWWWCERGRQVAGQEGHGSQLWRREEGQAGSGGKEKATEGEKESEGLLR